MLIPPRFERSAASILFDPQPLLDALADLNQLNPGYRLSFQEVAGVFLFHGKDEFEIFSVTQSMIQRRFAVLHGLGIGTDGDLIRAQNGAAATLLQNMV